MRNAASWAVVCAVLSLVGGGSYAFLTNVLLSTPCSHACDAADTSFRKPWYATFLIISSNAITNLLALGALWAAASGRRLIGHKSATLPEAAEVDRPDGVRFSDGAASTSTVISRILPSGVPAFSEPELVLSEQVVAEPPSMAESLPIAANVSVGEPPYTPILTRSMALPLFYIALFDVTTVFLQVCGPGIALLVPLYLSDVLTPRLSVCGVAVYPCICELCDARPAPRDDGPPRPRTARARRARGGH